MRKEEYINKYGQDAWDRKTEKTKLWKQNHTDYKPPKKYQYSQTKSDYIEKYGQDAYDALLEKNREWKRKNKEKHIESVKKWQSENQDKTSEYKKRWKKTNKSLVNEYASKRRKTQSGRAQCLKSAYNQSDILKERGKCTISKNWIIEHIFNSKCIYCGDSDWTHLGCDRIDDNLPHTPDNCVCSCGLCNVDRSHLKMSVEEFVEYRKTHQRDIAPQKLQEIVEINGKKVIRKVL